MPPTSRFPPRAAPGGFPLPGLRQALGLVLAQVALEEPAVALLVGEDRDDHGRGLHPTAVAGVLAGVAVMFATGLLVA